VAVEGSGSALYLNDDTGVFSQASSDILALTAGLIALVAFDTDGDGDTDLAAGATRENQRIHQIGACARLDSRLWLRQPALPLVLGETPASTYLLNASTVRV
jgi:hypothetical protein